MSPTAARRQFVHLHAHTHFSLLDATIRIGERPQAALLAWP
jgi:DNA polymerase III alpha subunit